MQGIISTWVHGFLFAFDLRNMEFQHWKSLTKLFIQELPIRDDCHRWRAWLKVLLEWAQVRTSRGFFPLQQMGLHGCVFVFHWANKNQTLFFLGLILHGSLHLESLWCCCYPELYHMVCVPVDFLPVSANRLSSSFSKFSRSLWFLFLSLGFELLSLIFAQITFSDAFKNSVCHWYDILKYQVWHSLIYLLFPSFYVSLNFLLWKHGLGEWVPLIKHQACLYTQEIFMHHLI